MRRKAFDTILTTGGLVLAVVLVIAVRMISKFSRSASDPHTFTFIWSRKP